MNHLELNEIIHQPEGRRLEFKETLPSGSDLAKTAISFSNGAGGEIYIGITKLEQASRKFPESTPQVPPKKPPSIPPSKAYVYPHLWRNRTRMTRMTLIFTDFNQNELKFDNFSEFFVNFFIYSFDMNIR